MAWYSTEIQDISPDIGKIEAFMRTTAPTGYLACDGTTYNIGDYPLLEALFTSDFGSVNYFGGNGTTTWKVPDLRGEFLRCTGTNSHANSGDGANVGVHQSPTLVPNLGANTKSTKCIYTQTDGSSTDGGGGIGVLYADKYMQAYQHTTNTGLQTATNSLTTWNGGTGVSNYSVRPANTSVLYCIKAY